MQRLFEPPGIREMSPAAKIVAYVLLISWAAFVLFPIYWVVITAFKTPQAVNQGPFYIPFWDFQPTLDAWRTQFTSMRWGGNSYFSATILSRSFCHPSCLSSRWSRRFAKYTWHTRIPS
jgi:ABC-type glycerol-3-phosphate transport system permease component